MLFTGGKSSKYLNLAFLGVIKIHTYLTFCRKNIEIEIYDVVTHVVFCMLNCRQPKS
jgi:hypothetical protein